jgi:hypothetical protein
MRDNHSTRYRWYRPSHDNINSSSLIHNGERVPKTRIDRWSGEE